MRTISSSVHRWLHTRVRLASIAGCLGLLVAMMFVQGCAKAPSGPAVDAVEEYAAALPASLHGDTLKGIQSVATDEQVDRVRLYVAYVLNRGERMESTITRFAVLTEQTNGAQATVQTDEDWSIVYRRVTNPNQVVRTEKYRLHVSYSLVLQDGTWRVADIKELSRTPL